MTRTTAWTKAHRLGSVADHRCYDVRMARQLRALVVEDERAARRYLVELLGQHPSIEVFAAVESLDEANQALAADSGVRFDVAFVDIDLGGFGGSEVAGLALVEQYRGRPEAPSFVLATASTDHALAAYELGVTDYVLKPFSPQRVTECIDRLLARVGEPTPAATPSRIVARTRAGLTFVKVDEVLAVQAEQRLAYVHARGSRFDIDVTLSTFERNFGDRFLRVHRNWLVAREHVEGLERDRDESWVIAGGLRVPVARDRAGKVRKALLDGTLGIKG